ncbi:MAG: TraR/DksA family transcriptional regulator, partial [Actinomycetes bacterium]
ATASKATASKAAASKAAASKAAASTATPPKAVPTKATPRTAPPPAPVAAAPATLAVRQDEDPWTSRELGAVRQELETDLARLRSELSEAEADLADLLRDGRRRRG